MVRAAHRETNIMNAQTNNEILELADHELDSVVGGNIAVAVVVGLATNALYDWLKAPGDVKAWESHLKSIL
jgi:hypothetical protein